MTESSDLSGAFTSLRGTAMQLGVPIKWLASEADAGRIPCLNVGRRRLFNVDAVRRVLAERAASSAATESEARQADARS